MNTTPDPYLPTKEEMDEQEYNEPPLSNLQYAVAMANGVAYLLTHPGGAPPTPVAQELAATLAAWVEQMQPPDRVEPVCLYPHCTKPARTRVREVAFHLHSPGHREVQP